MVIFFSLPIDPSNLRIGWSSLSISAASIRVGADAGFALLSRTAIL
jgi:hypothetical protein